jgi:ABC-2 type transport system ATP-binding protein
VVAVDGLDLEVLAGECFGLLGPNGAGKTTTVEILEGLLEPDAGAVEILGMRWGADDRAIRQRLGVQLQETQLAEKLTVEETLRIFRSFFERGRSVDEVLKIVELEEKRSAWVSRLSGGQQQRLAVASALVSEPELLFLDEPTTGLDPQSRRQLWELILEFKASGGTVLLTTHYMEEAERLCDRVAVVDNGRVIALGTPDALIAQLGAEHVVEIALELDDPGVDEWLGEVGGVKDVRRERHGIFLTVSEVHRTVPALLAALRGREVELSRLTTHHATLEDVFVSLTGRHLRDE